jgi:hypothetical protein
MKNNITVTSALLAVVLMGCNPAEPCGGNNYYDADGSHQCLACPEKSTRVGGTCVCNESDYEFVNRNCVLKADAMVAEAPSSGDDSGADMAAGPTCADYCDFVNACIGENGLAMSVLTSVVTDLKADDVVACTAACEGDVGGDGSADPAVLCMVDGRAAAACEGDDTQAGLAGGLGLVGDCCKANAGNALCASICVALKANALVASMVDFCD